MTGIQDPRELKTIGDHLRKKRLELKLLQKEVAQMLGVDEVTVYNWEKNRASPRLQHTPKVVEFLGYLPFEEPETLGERIVYYRRLGGVTQKELAKKIGVDPATLARWERGEREPQGAYRERLVSFLDSLTLPPSQEMSKE